MSSLKSELKAGTIICPLRGKKFLPLDVLDKKITADTVKTQLPMRIRLFHNGLCGQIAQEAKQIFAILVLMEESHSIRELWQEGLRDKHLPLKKRNGNDDVLVSETGDEFRSFRIWGYARIKTFLKKQWRFLSPVFKDMGSQIVLDSKCALPLLQKHEKVGHGQASTVYEAWLHPRHQIFAPQETGLHIAVKEFHCTDDKTSKIFEQEKSNLEKVQQLWINNEHIVKHIATCVDESYGYVLFPWADGRSLTDFWGRQNSAQRNDKLFLWSFRQMLALASALKALHNVNCRHGDLKPDNILNFKNDDGEDILLLADLGVSRFHTVETDLRPNPTQTQATTPSYEGPEVYEYERKGLPRRRTYDIWSMGCIFLEFAIWLLYDCEAILSFRHSRDPPYQYFYKETGTGRADRHSKVSEAMNTLRKDPRCEGNTAVGDLLDLIDEHLLLVKVESRYSAEELHARIQQIVQDAEENGHYLLRVIDPQPMRPTIFQRSSFVSHSGSGFTILPSDGK